MTGLLIYHHLGLGDHIVCNGLVRYFREKSDVVGLFCKKQNYENVKYLYRDDPGISLIPMNDDADVVDYIHTNNLLHHTLRVGFEKLSRRPGISFDEDFYIGAGVPFEFRFSKFLFQRDITTEAAVVKALNPSGEKYIFVHGNLDQSRIRTDLKIITNPKQFKIFDIITILEGAEEIHMEESSVKCLVNSILLSKPRIFFHRYARYPMDDYLNGKGINPVTIYD